MNKAQLADVAKEEARAHLRTLLKPGSTVYTCLKHVSSSGMSRRIVLLVVHKSDYYKQWVLRDISYHAAEATGFRYNGRHSAIQVGGCGMDMGFHCVYTLSRALFPKGFKLPKGTPGRSGDTSGFDTDGGYALTHKWI